MKTLIFLMTGLLFFSMKSQAQTVTDYDGNVYDTILIGGQAWLKENLKVTHYCNGDPIPNRTGNSSWSGLNTGARCYYNNDSAAYHELYGPLYNWHAVTNQNGICPAGWHVPTDGEWTALEIYLGGSMVAGGKMKEAGTSHWLSPNTGATNSSGFTGLPGGMLGTSFTFQTINENGLWWTSTAQNSTAAWSRYLWYMFAGVDRNPTPKTIGLSIRCIKDLGVGLGNIEENKIRVFPNPARRMVKIEIPEGKDMPMLIRNFYGEVLLQQTLDKCVNQVDLGALEPGAYLVSVISESGVVCTKLFKE